MSETSQSDRRWKRLRRAEIGVLATAIAITALMALLVLAAWRNDYLISSDKGVTSAEVLSAGRLRSAVIYVTPDGKTHNPKVGVLYPTNLTAGERINVEYSRGDPDLVRVAGRDVRVALLPALSVVVAVWVVTLPTLWILIRSDRRKPGSRGRTPGDRDGRLSRAPDSSPELSVSVTST